jgi:hypothetical protein
MKFGIRAPLACDRSTADAYSFMAPVSTSNILAQLLSTSVLALKYEYELNCQGKKVNFINLSENEGLSPSGIALSFDGFGSISWHSVLIFIRRLFHSLHFFFGFPTFSTCAALKRLE